MFTRFILSFMVLGAALNPTAVFAQEEVVEEGNDEVVEEQVVAEARPVVANAGTDKNVVVGRTVLFDGSASTGNASAELQYTWDFGDGFTAEGLDATHIYNSSGRYPVTLTVTQVIDDVEEVSTDTVIVSVQDRLVILITDQSVSKKQIDDAQKYALTQGTLIVPIRDTGVDQEYLTIQNLAQNILKAEQDFSAANTVITWTSGNTGLHALVELSRIASLNEIPLETFAFGNKAIVALTNQSLTSTERVARNAYRNVQPQYIIVSEEEVINDVLRADSIDELLRSVTTSAADNRIITEYTARELDKLGPFNFMSYAMNFMVNNGVPINSLFLILMIPVLATIVAFARQLLGVKAFGLFAPTVLALSFLVTGLKYGVTVFVAILLAATIARYAARKFRLLYLPRMSIVLSMLALAVFAMFLVGAYFNKTGFIAISIFPILIMAVLSEQFVAIQIQHGNKRAVILTVETLLLAVLGYLIADWSLFKTTILAYPELIFLTFVINFAIGKYAGLRLNELIRFRKVFKHMQ